MMDSWEWQLTGDDEWDFGAKVRGAIRVCQGEVYFDAERTGRDGGWVWLALPAQGVAVSRRAAMAEVEAALGLGPGPAGAGAEGAVTQTVVLGPIPSNESLRVAKAALAGLVVDDKVELRAAVIAARLVDRAVAEAREACARVAEDKRPHTEAGCTDIDKCDLCEEIAAAIRARR